MRSQFHLAESDPNALNMRLEDFSVDFNATVERMLR
jgi:hypothetical protein